MSVQNISSNTSNLVKTHKVSRPHSLNGSAKELVTMIKNTPLEEVEEAIDTFYCHNHTNKGSLKRMAAVLEGVKAGANVPQPIIKACEKYLKMLSRV